jgi:hypothetical protein
VVHNQLSAVWTRDDLKGDFKAHTFFFSPLAQLCPALVT